MRGGVAEGPQKIKMGSSLTTASNSSVLVINGGSTCNVFWQVGSSATLGTTTTFAGNILADQSITLNTGASLSGRALARIGAVTLDGNRVTACGLSSTGGAGAGIPTLTTWGLLILMALTGLVSTWYLRRAA